MTLAEFLLARIADDEEMARKILDRDQWRGIHVDSATEVAVHIERFNPARVLADCEAKRRVVSLCSPKVGDELSAALGEWNEAAWRGDQVIRALALPYAGHPQFREEWRP